jgi:hypothetical protein
MYRLQAVIIPPSLMCSIAILARTRSSGYVNSVETTPAALPASIDFRELVKLGFLWVPRGGSPKSLEICS